MIKRPEINAHNDVGITTEVLSRIKLSLIKLENHLSMIVTHRHW
jgi:hypothetical protein